MQSVVSVTLPDHSWLLLSHWICHRSRNYPHWTFCIKSFCVVTILIAGKEELGYSYSIVRDSSCVYCLFQSIWTRISRMQFMSAGPVRTHFLHVLHSPLTLSVSCLFTSDRKKSFCITHFLMMVHPSSKSPTNKISSWTKARFMSPDIAFARGHDALPDSLFALKR